MKGVLIFIKNSKKHMPSLRRGGLAYVNLHVWEPLSGNLVTENWLHPAVTRDATKTKNAKKNVVRCAYFSLQGGQTRRA